MSKTIIRVENLSKAYQLGEFTTGTLSRDISRKWAMMRGKEDPFLKVGETNDRTSKGDSDIVWSLKDINFDIGQGDAVGIIGRNGAGKSTLLKILSRVTTPTTGSIKVKGRIASLLEVGTGFHPELTGRENIFLNGAILGMRKAEIKKHLDAIVDFAGVERYIDTPVKRYSSGMYVRLAFAVAAHLESEILIVDEVLAVGDAEFQQKCLGKMNDVSKGEGRTVLFVSHNMGSIASLCTSAILLKNGNISAMGSIGEVVDKYIQTNTLKGIYKKAAEKPIQILEASTKNSTEYSEEFPIDEDINVNITFAANSGKNLFAGVALLDKNKNKIFTNHHTVSKVKDSENRLVYTIPKNTICPGVYSFDIALFTPDGQVFDYVSDVCPIAVVETGSSMFYDTNFGSVFVNCAWNEED